MAEFPRSLIEFQRRFPDERACAAYLARARWPDGFRCPSCGHAKGWELSTKAFTWECAGCGRQTSVTAGTVMHAAKLPLTVWFWAAYLMATHSNGIAALQLQAQLGLGSYKSAWLMCAKLRREMVAPGRAPLAGLVEIDETAIPLRRKDDPPAGGQGRRLATIADCSARSLHALRRGQRRVRRHRQDRRLERLSRRPSRQGKLLVAGGVEVHDGGPGRVPASSTTRTSSARWPPTSSCRGPTAAGRGKRRAPRLSGWRRRREAPAILPRRVHLSLQSPRHPPPPSAPCSASPSPECPPPTKC
jgi:Transposase zinc-ribbon domain